MIRVVVNADDFGISEGVNDAICLAFEKRIITNTTLMVNMPFAMEAVNAARLHGFEDRVGLHLNLTAGVPLTGAIRSLDRFCDARGDFHAHFHQSLKGRLVLNKKEREAVHDEIEAQIRRYLTYGLPQVHLDSHHHVHTDLSVWSIAEPLLKKYGFHSARISRNIYVDGKCSFVNQLYKKYLNKRIKSAGFDVAEYFGSYEDFKWNYSRLPDDSMVEVMVHPMFTEEGELVDTLVPMEEIKSFLDSNHVLLHSY